MKIKKVLKIRTHPHGVDGVIQLKSVIVVVIRIPASTEENASLSKKWTKGSLSAPARNISLATSARTVILHVFYLVIFLFHSFFPSQSNAKNAGSVSSMFLWNINNYYLNLLFYLEITACKGGCLNGGKCVESNEEPERNECQCTDRYYGRSCSKLRSVPNGMTNLVRI